MRLDLNKIIGYFIHRDDRFLEIKLLRDWKVMLSIFLLLFVLISAGGGYIFWKFQKGSFVDKNGGSGKKDGIIMLEKDKLDRVLDELESRENNHSRNLDAPEIKDPSL